MARAAAAVGMPASLIARKLSRGRARTPARRLLPLQRSAVTGFLFPLSVAYAVVKRDLLKVDVFLVRAGSSTTPPCRGRAARCRWTARRRCRDPTNGSEPPDWGS